MEAACLFKMKDSILFKFFPITKCPVFIRVEQDVHL